MSTRTEGVIPVTKKWKVLAPLVATAAGALAAGLSVLLKKLEEDRPAEAAAPAPEAAKALETGSYSFVSGYKDAATVEMTLQYDPEAFSFDVIGEDFLCYSGDSHVAVLRGELFSLQLEYAAFYSGEDFAAREKELAEKYQSFGWAQYGSVSGLKYLEGDGVCFNFPIDGDAYSYLLVTAFKGPEFDDDISLLPDAPELAAVLGSIRFQRS